MEPAETTPNMIVGIGASAGGLMPIQEFFDSMPADSGLAFVVVQHLSPDFKSLMDELLSRHTEMAIHKVTDGIKVNANSMYLIPPEKNMALADGKLLLTDQGNARKLKLPIDIFFHSLAKEAGSRSVAIVLSGTGSDGSRGVQSVHEAGGIVIVQSPESAGFDGMPRAAIKTNTVDAVCNPTEIAKKVLDYSITKDRNQLSRPVGATATASGESAIYNILRLFRLHHGLDFALYKPATITRRIDRRIQLGGFDDLAAYAAFLEDSSEELEILFRDLLVEVTQFFRDEKAFERLRREIIPNLVRKAQPNEEIRVWVPGCATGEEAYSMAMLFADAIERSGRPLDFKVFATDVHRNSLETASMAVYPNASMENVPEEFRYKYLTQNNGLCHVKRDLRQKVIFAANDLTSDPPFTRIDLISCRNVLIYLESKIQKRILSLFHFGLKTKGILFLGPSETVGDLAPEFETIDRHWRIYSKRRDVRLPDAARMPVSPSLQSLFRDKNASFVATGPQSNPQAWLASAHEDLLAKYVPPSLLINEIGELVHSFGDARKVLIQPQGRPTLEAVKMMPGELRTAVSAGLHRAKMEDKPVVFRGIKLETSKGTESFKVTIEPYRKATQSLYLVSIEPMVEQGMPESIVKDFDAEAFSNERINQLERELGYTRETLQATVEELETSNEELQSTNEELIASNEELQSTNEELHSVNEELYTVNTEHKQKIEELTQLTSDMDNLLRSTDIGTIFLDQDFKIRMFTPAITAAFNVMDQDIGRPIEHIAYKLDSPTLISDAEDVLDSGEAKEVEVQNAQRQVYLQRMQPYKTENGEVQGIVLTTTDITAIREAQRAQLTYGSITQIEEELPDFAYAVSHDLQAPLRHISQYSQLIEQNLHRDDVMELKRCIRVINESAASARGMLDGLLSFSRINSRGRPLNRVSLADVVADAVQDLAASITFHDTKMTIGELPEVSGDSEQLETLFFHLFDNAIKYCDEKPPEICVDATCSEGAVHITVRDNGIGVEKRHCERVFTIFKRLGFKEGVPGAGVGLSLCKRIVLRHGGRIWMEPGEDIGTICHVVLHEYQLPEEIAAGFAPRIS